MNVPAGVTVVEAPNCLHCLLMRIVEQWAKMHPEMETSTLMGDLILLLAECSVAFVSEKHLAEWTEKGMNEEFKSAINAVHCAQAAGGVTH